MYLGNGASSTIVPMRRRRPSTLSAPGFLALVQHTRIPKYCANRSTYQSQKGDQGGYDARGINWSCPRESMIRMILDITYHFLPGYFPVLLNIPEAERAVWPSSALAIEAIARRIYLTADAFV